MCSNFRFLQVSDLKLGFLPFQCKIFDKPCGFSQVLLAKCWQANMLMFRRRNVVACFEEQHAKTLVSHSVLSCRRMCTRTNSDNRVPSRFGHHVICANIRYTADQSLLADKKNICASNIYTDNYVIHWICFFKSSSHTSFSSIWHPLI